jgi:hypothetical protein
MITVQIIHKEVDLDAIRGASNSFTDIIIFVSAEYLSILGVYYGIHCCKKADFTVCHSRSSEINRIRSTEGDFLHNTFGYN